MDIREAARLHHELGRFYAQTTAKVIRRKKWRVDLLGLHGQTVFHEAPKTTLQIGEASYLASLTNRPVISDFRVADLSVGGQAAPLATFFHALLLKNHMKEGPCAFHNLGGISNVSYFPKGKIDVRSLGKKAISGKILSFDTGPANMLMDCLLQKQSPAYDRNGDLAASGFVDYLAIEKWMASDLFIKKAPPKSCGREEYGLTRLTKLLKMMKSKNRADQAATLTEFTAYSIAHSYRKFLPRLPRLAVFSGGGVKNSHLMFRIRYHLPEVKIVSSEDLGWPSQAIEGGAFGALAVARHLQLIGQIPQTTGAKKTVLLGKIVQTTI